MHEVKEWSSGRWPRDFHFFLFLSFVSLLSSVTKPIIPRVWIGQIELENFKAYWSVRKIIQQLTGAQVLGILFLCSTFNMRKLANNTFQLNLINSTMQSFQ